MTNSANDKLAGPSSNRHSVQALRETLAGLEHDQWCEWSRSLAESEELEPARLAAWRARWVPYGELSEADKDLDRAYADRVIRLLESTGVTLSSDRVRAEEK
jgi:hypothetical protein